MALAPKKAATGSSVATPLCVYVSQKGNDSATGDSSKQIKGSRKGPFATIKRALQEVNSCASTHGITKPIEIILDDGLHFLDKTIQFKSKNSGQQAKMQAYKHLKSRKPVSFKALPGTTPVISGGVLISGFREIEHKGKRAWCAQLPDVKKGNWNFSQLYVNGSRRSRPRIPATDAFTFWKIDESEMSKAWNVGQNRFYYEHDEFPDFKNLTDVELVPVYNWVDDHIALTAHDTKKKRIDIARRAQYHFFDGPLCKPFRYYIDNAWEALSEPGQWYLDRPAGNLYYLPCAHETLKNSHIIAPRLPVLVEIGDPQKPQDPVGAIDFEGISFAHNEWRLPADMTGKERGQGMPETDGMIMIHGASDCTFSHCSFSHSANYGIDMRSGAHDIVVHHCEFTHMGAGGVKIWHQCHRNTVSDCEISYLGEIFPSGIGIIAGAQCDANKFIHNHIHHVCYSAISVGWCWGYLDERRSCGNIIEYNHIHDVGMHKLADMGAIYTLGVSTGTRIRYNRIYDVDSAGYGGWGIYPDEGTTDMLIENNIVYRTSSSPFNQTFGRNTMVRNNIFAFGKGYQVMQTRGENHLTAIFEKNIFYFEEGDVVGGHEGSFMEGNCRPQTIAFKNNCYFGRKKRPVFEKGSFAAWKKRGFDEGSRIVDPQFVNSDKGDFRLNAQSPAFALGFRDFDMSEVGPRP